MQDLLTERRTASWKERYLKKRVQFIVEKQCIRSGSWQGEYPWMCMEQWLDSVQKNMCTVDWSWTALSSCGTSSLKDDLLVM